MYVIATHRDQQLQSMVNRLQDGVYSDRNFRRVQKMAKSDHYLRHVRPSVRMEQLGSHLTDFHEI